MGCPPNGRTPHSYIAGDDGGTKPVKGNSHGDGGGIRKPPRGGAGFCLLLPNGGRTPARVARAEGALCIAVGHGYCRRRTHDARGAMYS